MDRKTQEIIRDRIDRMDRNQLLILNLVLDILESLREDPEFSKEQNQEEH